MAKICFVGLPGKIGRCIITGPQPPPVHPQKTSGIEEPGIYPEIFVDASIIGWYNYIYHDNSAGNALIKKYNVRSVSDITSCSTCHR